MYEREGEMEIIFFGSAKYSKNRTFGLNWNALKNFEGYLAIATLVRLTSSSLPLIFHLFV